MHLRSESRARARERPACQAPSPDVGFSRKDMSLLRQPPASDEGHEGANRWRVTTPSQLGKQPFLEVESRVTHPVYYSGLMASK